VAQRLPRFSRIEIALEDRAKLRRILQEVDLDGAADAKSTPATRSASGHDRWRMRGLPIVGRSTPGGAIAGTDPVGALLRKEARGELRL
jgi:hypothetical protein